jgi:predicted molibdopterin-dependent oxidoreductase YjgC
MQADVVVPIPGFTSAAGTFTNTESRLLAATPVVESFILYASWQICKEIAGIAGLSLEWESESDISREMNDALPVYKYAVIGEAQARSGNREAKDVEEAVSNSEPAAKGKLVSPLPTSDNLTRGANRQLGVSVYGD